MRRLRRWRRTAPRAAWRVLAGLALACAFVATARGGQPAYAAPLPLGLLSIERIFAEATRTLPD